MTGLRRTLAAAALSAVLAVGLAACGDDQQRDEPPEQPALRIDETDGTVEGVGIGDGRAAIERVFGDAPPGKDTDPSTPIGIEPSDLTLAGSGRPCPDTRGQEVNLRYRGVAFFGYESGICEVTVTSEEAKTLRGLSPGDPIAEVEDLYPELACGETKVSADAGSPEPACWGEAGEGVHLWIGGDPINQVSLAEGPIRPRR